MTPRLLALARPDGYTLLWGSGSSLASAPVLKAFETLGFTPAYSRPAQMSERIAQGKARYERIVKDRGIRVG